MYKAAVDDNDEFAELAAQLKRDEPEKVPKVPLVRYDEVVRRLDDLYDVLNAINETLVAVNSGRKRTAHRPNRAPRPETATQRLGRRRQIERLDEITNRMTGGR